MSTDNVIVTDSHYRAAVAAIRELAQRGYRVFAAYPEGEAVPLGAYSNCCSERLPLGGDPTDSLLECARELKAVIFPGGARFLSMMARRLDEFSTFALISGAETLKNANDKIYVARLARSMGIRVPETLDHRAPEKLKYPVIVKYADGEALGKKAAERYALADSPKALAEAIERMGEHRLFTSEYIAGGGFGVSVLMDRQRRAVRVFCHERLREYPLAGGPSVMCRSVWCESMAHDAVRLLKALDFEGLAMVEFRGTPDSYALLEINPRVWGSFPLQYLADAKFADAYARAAAGRSLGAALKPDYRLGVTMQYFISGARWAVESVKRDRSPAPLFKLAAEAVNPAVHHGLWSARDMQPGIEYVRALIKRGERNEA